nr:hypothetical protein [uncultured bacterium]
MKGVAGPDVCLSRKPRGLCGSVNNALAKMGRLTCRMPGILGKGILGRYGETAGAQIELNPLPEGDVPFGWRALHFICMPLAMAKFAHITWCNPCRLICKQNLMSVW